VLGKEDEAYAGFKDGRVQRGRPGDIWGSGKRESGPDRVYIQRTEEMSCYCYLGGSCAAACRWIDRFSRAE